MQKRLLSLRKALKLNQEELAAYLGITRAAYGKIETGVANLSDRNRKMLIDAFAVDPVWLDSGVGEMFQNGVNPETLNISVNERIRHLAEDLFGADFNEMARVAWVSASRLKKIASEESEPTLQEIRTMCKKMGLSIDWLFTGKVLKDDSSLSKENIVDYKEKYIIALEKIVELKSTIIDLQKGFLDQNKKVDADTGAEVADAI